MRPVHTRAELLAEIGDVERDLVEVANEYHIRYSGGRIDPESHFADAADRLRLHINVLETHLAILRGRLDAGDHA